MKSIEITGDDCDLIAIVEDVSRTGQPIALTRGGKPYVDLVPSVPRRRSNAEILDEMRELTKNLEPMTQSEIRAAIEEGRR